MIKGGTRSELIQRHRAIVEAVSEQDFDGAMSFFAPRAVWMAEPNWEREALAGSDAIRAFLEDWFTDLERA